MRREICDTLKPWETKDDDAKTDTGDFRVGKAAASPPFALSQDAFRSRVCPGSRGDRSACGIDVNCRPLEDDLSNHNMAAGMRRCHDHRPRTKANRKSLPSGSVILSAHSVNVLWSFISGFKILRLFAQCKTLFSPQ